MSSTFEIQIYSPSIEIYGYVNGEIAEKNKYFSAEEVIKSLDLDIKIESKNGNYIYTKYKNENINFIKSENEFKFNKPFSVSIKSHSTLLSDFEIFKDINFPELNNNSILIIYDEYLNRKKLETRYIRILRNNDLSIENYLENFEKSIIYNDELKDYIENFENNEDEESYVHAESYIINNDKLELSGIEFQTEGTEAYRIGNFMETLDAFATDDYSNQLYLLISEKLYNNISNYQYSNHDIYFLL
jgi:hypothetical protein